MLPIVMTEAKSPKPENTLTIELKHGPVLIELFPDKAPKHVERIKKLASEGKYDGVAFHRVIEGFMAQTGDVEHGNKKGFNSGRVGTGGSDLPDLKQEFNDVKNMSVALVLWLALLAQTVQTVSSLFVSNQPLS